MSTKKLVGAIATAAAIVFVIAPVTSTVANAASTKAPCYGVNSCKGKSDCKTAVNACKGKNGCKGTGVSMQTAKKCAKMKGSTTPPAATN